MAKAFLWKVEARDTQGRVSCSWHSTKEQAQASAANCKGRYPWGNRVKLVKDYNLAEEVETDG